MRYCNNNVLGVLRKQIKCFTRFSRSVTTQNEFRPSYMHHIGKSPLVNRTIGQQLALTVEQFPDRNAIVSCHEKNRISFAEVLSQADRLAAGFRSIGLERGDRIGLMAPNNINWYITMMAAVRAGLILVAINPAYQVPELEYCINKVDVKAIVAPESNGTQNFYKLLAEIVPEMSGLPNGRTIQSKRVPSLSAVVIDTDKDLPGIIKFSELLALSSPSEVAKISAQQQEIQSDSGCNIQFTSGTTGKPKAALLSHFNFVNNGLHIASRHEFDQSYHKICLQVPLFHAFGIVIGVMSALTSGSTLVLPDNRFNAAASIRAIQQEQCTAIFGTPTMFVDLVAKTKETNAQFESVQMAVTGGAPCSPQLFTNIKNVLGARHVKTVFGLTETTAVIFNSIKSEPMDKVLNTVGHLQDHVEAKVIDANGNIVPFGMPGELCVRGYCNMLGYFKDETKTAEMIGPDRWLRTGDQFVMLEDGYGKIVGRLKEMIIRGGENIFPKEIEDFLNTHPDILESYVIGVPDDRLGEEVCAYIRLAANSKDIISREAIKEYGQGKIAYFKIPRFIRVVDTFPKTASGKIQKFKLQKMFEDEKNETK